MQAQKSLREANIDDALEDLMTSVRDDPANVDLRVYLFQLLVVDGQYERALVQLNVIGEMDAKTLMMVQTYREVLQCERFREDVFAGTRTPLIFGDPEPWVAPLLESVKLVAKGEHEKAQQLRDDAYKNIPAISGSINGEPFEWLADADSRVGPFMEAIVNGKYFWIPTSCIQRIELHEPEDLRDMVWLPAEFTWRNEGAAVGFVPVRYIPVGQEPETNPLCKLSRITDWQQMGPDTFYGLGQRLLTTEKADYALLDVREIAFEQVKKSEKIDDKAIEVV